MNSKDESYKLGFWSIVLLAINSIIGSGIFLTPGSVVSQAGNKALLVYFIAAIFASILAVSFASAAKYVTKSGAAYAYAKAAFGDNVGFYIGVLRYFSASVAWGVMAVGVIKSTISIFGGDPNNYANVTIGFLILMGIITLINVFGQNVVKYIMNLATIAKLAALALIIIAGALILMMTGANHFNEVNSIRVNGHLLGSNLATSSFVMAIVSAFYAFTGFESVASGSEDMKNPAKNLPRAIPLAILSIALIYIGVVAVAMMINPQALVATKQVVAISAIFSNQLLRNIILVGALVSMFGINVAASFNSPRVLEAMAREGQMPHWMVKRTKHDFPARTFLITIVLAVIIPMSFQYNMINLITLSAMVRFLGFIVVPISVMLFYNGRSAEPILKAQRSFFTDIIIPIISVILTIVLLFKYSWTTQFGMIVNGRVVPNWYAIGSVIFGFVVLPLILAILVRLEQRDNDQ